MSPRCINVHLCTYTYKYHYFVDYNLAVVEGRLVDTSGGSWGLGALEPAILWGPLQGHDPTFPSWSVGAGAQGAVSPTTVSGAEPPIGKAFWQEYIEHLLKIRYRDRRLHNSNPIGDVVAYGKSRYPSRL